MRQRLLRLAASLTSAATSANAPGGGSAAAAANTGITMGVAGVTELAKAALGEELGMARMSDLFDVMVHAVGQVR